MNYGVGSYQHTHIFNDHSYSSTLLVLLRLEGNFVGSSGCLLVLSGGVNEVAMRLCNGPNQHLHQNTFLTIVTWMAILCAGQNIFYLNVWCPHYCLCFVFTGEVTPPVVLISNNGMPKHGMSI